MDPTPGIAERRAAVLAVLPRPSLLFRPTPDGMPPIVAGSIEKATTHEAKILGRRRYKLVPRASRTRASAACHAHVRTALSGGFSCATWQATAAARYLSKCQQSRAGLENRLLNTSGYSGYPPGKLPGTRKCRIICHGGLCLKTRGCDVGSETPTFPMFPSSCGSPTTASRHTPANRRLCRLYICRLC